jgi:hypothetical protein
LILDEVEAMSITREEGGSNMWCRRGAIVSIGLFTLLVCAAWGLSAEEKKDAPAAETLRGIMWTKGDTWVEVRREGDPKSERYQIAPEGSRLDVKNDAFLKSLRKFSEVEIVWKLKGDVRQVVSLTLVAAPGSSGTVVGVITDKSTDEKNVWVEIRDDQGKLDRFVPRWVGGPGYGQFGGWEKEMTKTIADRNIGDRVEIKKSVDDHVRVLSLRLLAAAKKPPAKTGDSGAK